MVLQIKRRYRSPYIIVAGDFNQWPAEDAFLDDPEIQEAHVGPTRGGRSIDRTFINFPVNSWGILPPLETDGADGSPVRKSDHMVTYIWAALPKIEAFKFISYSYRYKNPESDELLGAWLVGKDWKDVVQARGSNRKAELYNAAVMGAVEHFFTTRRKSTDPPWVNAAIRRLVRRRKRVYVEEGRSPAWKRMKKRW